jgi:glycosyltransferase involved in cell wall biosynthesis
VAENQFILFLGRITEEKRIEWIIKTFQQIKTNKKLVIAGDNFLDPQYVNSIKQLSKKNSNIIFTGHVIGELKNELLQNCLFFVLPSIIEGQSIALIEAMSYHKPILVADISPHTEMIPNKHFLFRQNNFADFKKKLTNLLHQEKNEVRYSYLKILPSKKEFDSMYEKLIEDLEHS